MDELLQKALERREQLRAELEALDSFILSYSDAKERRTPTSAQVDLFNPRQGSVRLRRAKENAAAMTDAEKIILQAGHPLSRSALLRELEKIGHRVEGSDKSKVLGTNLWRSKRFYNLKGAGYWPISEPVPEAFKQLAPRSSMLLDDNET